MNTLLLCYSDPTPVATPREKIITSLRPRPPRKDYLSL
jgi:hypothetical protein